MANDFYTPEQAAKTAVSLVSEDLYLSGLISRNYEDDLLGGGGKGRAVNIKVPSALVARSRGIDDVTTSIVLDSIAERTVSISLGEHIYSAVGLSEGDLNLDLADFGAQVLKPQTDAVVDRVENMVSAALAEIALDTEVTWDEDNPIPTFTKIRQRMRGLGVPASNLNVAVGTDVYAALLDAKAITDASESGSTEALREGQIGKIRGFSIVESTRLEASEIVAFHRDAFTLAVRAPKVPQGAKFGSSVSAGGFSLRYLRDYDAMHTQDRSVVSTFAGVAALPLYKITRDQATGQASVTEVAGGATFRMSTETAPAPAAE